MAYCKKCGAYIPDGQTKCLACGYDEIEGQEKAAAEAQSAAQTQNEPRRFGGMSSEELRRELERQRAKRQEDNRRWAEAEREKRAKAAEEAPTEKTAAHKSSGISEGGLKLFAAASYISVLFIFPYLFCGDSEFAKFHAKQGLGLFVFGVIADIIGSIFPVAWLLWLVRIYCAIKGITTALDGRMEKLPLIGKYIK